MLQSMGLLRVGHDWVTSLSLSTFMHWRRKWQPLQRSCLGNPRDGEAWWAAVYGVSQSRTRLKQLSSNSSSNMENSRDRGVLWLPWGHKQSNTTEWLTLLDLQMVQAEEDLPQKMFNFFSLRTSFQNKELLPIILQSNWWGLFCFVFCH